MAPEQSISRACQARLRELLTPDEEVLAVGAAAEFRDGTEDFSPQGRGRFVLVTPWRLLMTEFSRNAETEAIPFDSLVRWADGTQSHRYVVRLSHPPLQRIERVPAHRILWVEWGTARQPKVRETTTLRFSHRDTAAASALRIALESSGADHRPLALKETSRAERTAGSHVVLRAEGARIEPPD